jgi:MoaA/NifB/PqqE/SkfB family radical SAM enzyme
MEPKSYCVLPYNHMSIDPVGRVRPCCNYNFHKENFPKHEWPFINVNTGKSIKELVSGGSHTALRSDIENNIKHEFCNRCWVVEDGGGHSYRQDWNRKFLGQNDPTNFKTDISIEYVEMTLGNKCNIQCRMCNPWSSNLWAEEIIEHPELNHWDADMTHVNFEWYNTPQFDKILEEIIPTVKHLNLLGGEPLFNPKYYDILQRIVDSGRAKEVSLQFNTNLLSLQDKTFDLWKEFGFVNANVSCDGVGIVNEYVRWPGKWSKFVRNLERIIEWQRQLGGNDVLMIQLHSTVSSLTWLNMGELFKWSQTLPIYYSLPFVIQVNQPQYMDAIHMPDRIKQIGYERIIDAISPVTDWQVNNIHSLIDYIINTPQNTDMWEMMIKETNKLDRARNCNILDIIPEYKEFWHDAI